MWAPGKRFYDLKIPPGQKLKFFIFFIYLNCVHINWSNMHKQKKLNA